MNGHGPKFTRGLQNFFLAFAGEHARKRPVDMGLSGMDGRSDSYDPQANFHVAMERFNNAVYNHPRSVEVMPPNEFTGGSFQQNIQPAYTTPQMGQIPAYEAPQLPAPAPIYQPPTQSVTYQPPQMSTSLDISKYIDDEPQKAPVTEGNSPIYLDFSKALNPLQNQMEMSLKIQGKICNTVSKILALLEQRQQVAVATPQPVQKKNHYQQDVPQREVPIPESGEFPMDTTDMSDEDMNRILDEYSGPQEEYDPDNDTETVPEVVQEAPKKPVRKVTSGKRRVG